MPAFVLARWERTWTAMLSQPYGMDIAAIDLLSLVNVDVSLPSPYRPWAPAAAALRQRASGLARMTVYGP